jgi:hypothetical protein
MTQECPESYQVTILSSRHSLHINPHLWCEATQNETGHRSRVFLDHIDTLP